MNLEAMSKDELVAAMVAMSGERDRHRLLAEASLELSRTPDMSVAIGGMLRLLSPAVADLAFVDVHDREGGWQGLEVSAADPSCRAVAAALERSGRRRLEVKAPTLLTGARDGALAEHFTGDLNAWKVGWLILSPLAAGDGEAVGLLGLLTKNGGRELSRADLALATDLAARAARAIAASRLRDDAFRALQARQNVLSVVSHDLRTPLSGILLSVDLMARSNGGPGSDPQRAHAQFERIRRAVARMERLIDDLLDLGSIDSGKLTLARELVCVLALIDDALDLLEPLARQKEISLVPPRALKPLLVFADGHRLLQVLSNLVSNAIKFGPRGSAVTVQLESGQALVSVTVADEGPGISTGDGGHLFERYWQADKNARQGRGLGLFISKRIVEAHGGTIGVESRPGAGTRVRFTVPASRGEAAALPAGLVVLLVEDDPALRELTTEVLLERGYQVVARSNGRDALDYLHTAPSRPALILTDLVMPAMDGRAFIGAVKSDARLAHIPIVVLSGSPELAVDRNLGIAGYLHKPFESEQLCEELRAAIGPR
ncbi:MAG: hybrid sensor histidine kinase/response regulator [Myxococcaceae bacterium]|nr:hybrid sensor histidine kinase/response regulator [Myxococcaceae bacterium]